MLILQTATDARPVAVALISGEKREFSADETAPMEEFFLYDVGLFLVALATENLLKGLWVGRNPERIKDIKNLGRDLKELTTHDLEKVAKAASMQLSGEEESLLRDLSELIVWYGRYSAPTSVEKYGDLLEGRTPSSRFMTGQDIFSMDLPFPAELDRFITRVLEELETIPKGGSTSEITRQLKEY